MAGGCWGKKEGVVHTFAKVLSFVIPCLSQYRPNLLISILKLAKNRR